MLTWWELAYSAITVGNTASNILPIQNYSHLNRYLIWFIYGLLNYFMHVTMVRWLTWRRPGQISSELSGGFLFAIFFGEYQHQSCHSLLKTPARSHLCCGHFPQSEWLTCSWFSSCQFQSKSLRQSGMKGSRTEGYIGVSLTEWRTVIGLVRMARGQRKESLTCWPL